MSRGRLAALASLALIASAMLRPCPAAPIFSRRIDFAGETWLVKKSGSPTAPQDNLFSDSPGSVYVDEAGALHLRIRKIDGRWWAAEVMLARSLGYGMYRFSLASRVDRLDMNIVAGFFTWSNKAAWNHREIDIEFSRWGGQLLRENAQFVVQPAGADSLFRFLAVQDGNFSSHSMDWRPGMVSFESRHGHPDEGRPFASLFPMTGAQAGPAWAYRGPNVPQAGDERFRINFYLFGGQAPSDANEAELVVSSFSFQPAP